MRINKYIATSGVASRRKAEELILQGRVSVNGKKIDSLGYQVDEKNDIVYVDEKQIKLEEKKIYIVLNKPEGYITTSKDQFGRKNVIDLVKDIKERIYPVGRLDYETSGLLIMTNDGDITYKITHPKYEVNKVYIASVKGIPTDKEIHDFENGLEIDDYITSKASLKVVKKDTIKKYSVCRVIIHEGHNRQVRKMFDAIGHPVMNLKRVQEGKIKLGDLKPGEYRHLTKEEENYLKSFLNFEKDII
ncbi:pseudouridine synthase [Peptostreptococcus faecalis]|uniref:pseudouridine synthase n=1 Tax=Peptostreptococcus faecalis TaxID=2045015 RepID=UPI000C7E0685|nr:pseudouridine synthase [Peptostreptococcus faecalis]